jgi:drug/metabolite transporter (DMT)-like permease
MNDESVSKEKSYLPYVTLLIVQLSFGSLPVTGKILMQTIPAFGLVGFRVGITALVLFIFQALKRDLLPKQTRDYWWFILLSFVGVTLNQLFFIKGLSLTKASNAALLAVTIPIFTIIISIFFGAERLRGIKVFGILVAAFGVLILIDPTNASFSIDTTTGDVLVILNSLCYAIFVVISKDVFIRNGAIKSTAWIFGLASLICVPIAGFSLRDIDMSALGSINWLLIAHISIICTVVPYLLVAWSVARVNPSTVAVFVYMQPLIGFSLAVAFLSEHFTVFTILAAILIFSGVFLATKKRKQIVDLLQ